MAYTQGYRPRSTQTQDRAVQRNAQPPQRPKTTRKAKRKKKGHPVRTFLTLVVFALAATLGVMFYMMYDAVGSVERDGTFYPGVYVDGVPLYGATPQQAYDYLANRAREELQDWSVQLRYGDQVWTIDTDTLGITGVMEYAVQEEINRAFYIGRGGSLIERYQVIADLRENPYYGHTADIEKNTAQIDSMLLEIQAAAYREPVNATSTVDLTRSGQPLIVTSEQAGQTVNTETLKAQITEYINSMESGVIQVEPEALQPAVTKAMLENEVVLIGRYVTDIRSSSKEGRNLNIERGVASFNGMVVKAGERVSFNKTTGLRTLENGFHYATEIVAGAYVEGVGGGICQVSSTLYNAVIQANLKVIERTNHGLPVNYIEMGADATVADKRFDFVFENDTDEAIYIMARVESGKKGKSVVFEIYGRPEPNGYSYKLRHETIEVIPIPEPEYKKDTDQEHVTYVDEEKMVSNGEEGAVVRTFLVVNDSYGNFVSEKLLYTDTFKAQAPKIYVGTLQRPE